MLEDCGCPDTTTKLARQQKHASHVIVNVPAHDPHQTASLSFRVFLFSSFNLRLASPKRNIQSPDFCAYDGVIDISEEEEIYVSLPFNSWSCRTYSSYSSNLNREPGVASTLLRFQISRYS